jgi:PadR family transcriptional regulator, regulatory protein PadR
MGAQHVYSIATRLEQVSGDLLHLNQGTLYPALVRLEQQGRIKGAWGKTETNREAKFYTLTKSGEKALTEETRRWRRMSGLVEKLLKESDQCAGSLPDLQTCFAAKTQSPRSPAIRNISARTSGSSASSTPGTRNSSIIRMSTA